jgi:hypothetical protein
MTSINVEQPVTKQEVVGGQSKIGERSKLCVVIQQPDDLRSLSHTHTHLNNSKRVLTFKSA